MFVSGRVTVVGYLQVLFFQSRQHTKKRITRLLKDSRYFFVTWLGSVWDYVLFWT